MFNNRLLGDKDALRVIKTLSALIAGHGQPQYEEQSSQFRPETAMAHMVWNATGLTPLRQWTERSFRVIAATAPDMGIEWRLVSRKTDRTANAEQFADTPPDEIWFDPNLCDVRGEFVSHTVLQLARRVVQHVNRSPLAEDETCARSRALQYLATAAYLHRGHVILSHIRKVDWHLVRLAGDLRTETPRTDNRPLDIESALIFAVVMVQLLHQRKLPQIIPLFGVGLNRAQAEKIHRAFRQGQSFQAELRLMRLMNRRVPRPSKLDQYSPTPARWSYY